MGGARHWHSRRTGGRMRGQEQVAAVAVAVARGGGTRAPGQGRPCEGGRAGVVGGGDGEPGR